MESSETRGICKFTITPAIGPKIIILHRKSLHFSAGVLNPVSSHSKASEYRQYLTNPFGGRHLIFHPLQ
jgi:hypothetical protein